MASLKTSSKTSNQNRRLRALCAKTEANGPSAVLMKHNWRKRWCGTHRAICRTCQVRTTCDPNRPPRTSTISRPWPGWQTRCVSRKLRTSSVQSQTSCAAFKRSQRCTRRCLACTVLPALKASITSRTRRLGSVMRSLKAVPAPEYTKMNV